MEPGPDSDRFSCPRCNTATEARFYGPCPRCRLELISTQSGPARAVAPGRFEPVLHVAPNQVATKE